LGGGFSFKPGALEYCRGTEMGLLKRIHSILNFLLKYITIILNLSIMGLILIDVAARYFFNQSFAEASELTLILAMWLYMLGAVIASDHNTHLRVEIFGLLFKGKKTAAVHRVMIAVINLAIVLFFIRWAYDLVDWAVRRPQMSPVLNVPWIVSQSSILLASLLIGVFCIREVVCSALVAYRLLSSGNIDQETLE
jgi:TRAP-type C4-dicarboxylate transport system permease small subunit